MTGNSTREVGLIVGLPESLAEDVLLENVTLSGREGLIIANAKGVTLKNVKVKAETGQPFVLHNAQVGGLPSAAKP